MNKYLIEILTALAIVIIVLLLARMYALEAATHTSPAEAETIEPGAADSDNSGLVENADTGE